MAKLTKNTTANIPTQNNLNDVIKSLSSFQEGAGIIEMVVNSAFKNKKLISKDTVQKLDTYSEVMDKVLGKKGVIMNMVTSLKDLSPHTKNMSAMIASVSTAMEMFNGKRLKRIGKNLERFKENFESLIRATEYITGTKVNVAAIEAAHKNMEHINKFYTLLNGTFVTITKMKVPLLAFVKLWMAKLVILQLLSTIAVVGMLSIMTPIIVQGTMFLQSMSKFFLSMAQLFNSIRKVNVGIMVIIKIWMMNMVLPMLMPVMITSIILGAVALIASVMISPIVIFMKEINTIFTSLKKTPASPLLIIKILMISMLMQYILIIITWGLLIGTALTYLEGFGIGFGPFVKVALVFVVIRKMFQEIRKTRVGLFTSIKLQMISKALNKVFVVLMKLSLLMVPPHVFISILMMTWMFKKMRRMFFNILILAPLALLAIPAMLILSLALMGLSLAMKLLVFTLKIMSGPGLALGLLKLILITSTFTIIALLFLALSLIAIDVVKSIIPIIALIGAVTIITAMIGVMGALMALMWPVFLIALPGLALMGLMVGLILVIACMLKLIQNLELDKDAIIMSVKTVMDTARLIIDSIFQRDDKKKGEKGEGGFMRILNSIGGTVAQFAGIILSIPFLMYTFVSIHFMLMIARKLKRIQRQDIDYDKVKDKVITCLNVANDIIQLLNTDKNKIKSSRIGKRILRQVKGTVKSLVNITENLDKIQKIKIDSAEIKASVENIFKIVADIDLMMEQFSNKEKVDINGSRPLKILSIKELRNRRKEIRAGKQILTQIDRVVGKINDIGEGLISIAEFKLDKETKDKIEANITSIFDYIRILDVKVKAEMMDGATKPEDIIDAAKFSKKKWRKAGKALSKVESTMANLQGIGEVLDMIKEFKFDKTTEDKITTNVDVMIGAMKKVISAVTGNTDTIKYKDKDLDRVGKVIDYVKALNNEFKTLSEIDATKTEKQFNNYIKFVDKVNSAEVEKLKTSARMFSQMARFSESIEGNFERLAETLNEYLLPTLEEMKAVIQSIPTKLDKGFSDTNKSIGAADGPKDETSIKEQIKREHADWTEEQIAAEAKKRLADNAKKKATGVEGKLDEMLDLMKGVGGNKVQCNVR